MKTAYHRSRGMALLTTLLVVSIASIIGVALVKRQWIDIRKTQNTLLMEQSWLYARGIEAWASSRLVSDLKKNGVDSEHDGWNQPIEPTQVVGGELTAAISDHQGQFNVNSLLVEGEQGKRQLSRFRRLLAALDLPQELAETTLDWLDADSEPHYPHGAEESYYTVKEPAFRPSNQAIVDISELRLVSGYTSDIYTTLAPHIAALPHSTTVNVNTASEPVLRSLGEGLTQLDAQAIIEARSEHAFEDMATFLEHPALAGITIDGEGLSLSSQYFTVSSEVLVGQLKLRYRSILYREAEDEIRVIQRIKQGLL